LVKSPTIEDNLKEIAMYIKENNMTNSSASDFLDYFVKSSEIEDARVTFVDYLCDKPEISKGYLNNKLTRLLKLFDNGYGAKAMKRERGKTRRKRVMRRIQRLKKNIKTKRRDIRQILSNTLYYCITVFNYRFIINKKKVIVVGPWFSEVGFELLYWIPFVRWVISTFNIDQTKILVISRGGVKTWYDQISNSYLDILSNYTIDEYKRLVDLKINTTGGQKHKVFTEADKIIIEDMVCNSVYKKRDIGFIHPSQMYSLFTPFWRRLYSTSFITKRSIYEQIKIRQDKKYADINNLPEKYYAVKFYDSTCMPYTKKNLEFIKKVISRLSSKHPVVILDHKYKLDDHNNINISTEDSEKIIYIDCKPENNLDIQTRVIKNAVEFWGTYGGFSYLAPQLGVPTFCFYSEEGKYLPVHEDIARRLFRKIMSGETDGIIKTDKKHKLKGEPSYSLMSVDSGNKLLFNHDRLS
jgi:hypothetical protein